MRGRTFVSALVAIVLLTLVLPPLGARQVHQRRIARAHDAVRRAAELAGSGSTGWVGLRAVAGGRLTVFRGGGAAPKFTPGVAWPESRSVDLPGAAPDPWGNGLLIVVGADPSPDVVVISAGPNGTVETPCAAPWLALGDDLVATGSPAR